jgi:protein involved in polysaccharide export with SLBB domain
VTGSEFFMRRLKILPWLHAALAVLICLSALPQNAFGQRPSTPSNGTPGFPSSENPGPPRRPSGDVDVPATSGSVFSRVNVGEDYVLRPGDKVSFSVAEERKAPQELTVMASGEIDVPYIGRYAVAGRSCRAVEAGLKAELEKKFFKHATVSLSLNQVGAMPLQGSANIRIYFTGAVRSQGAREFAPDNTITVSKAILIAGGFSDFADQKKVQLIRRLPNGKSQVTVVNVKDLLLGKSLNDPVLQAEDMIRVPEKLINF